MFGNPPALKIEDTPDAHFPNPVTHFRRNQSPTSYSPGGRSLRQVWPKWGKKLTKCPQKNFFFWRPADLFWSFLADCNPGGSRFCNFGNTLIQKKIVTKTFNNDNNSVKNLVSKENQARIFRNFLKFFRGGGDGGPGLAGVGRKGLGDPWNPILLFLGALRWKMHVFSHVVVSLWEISNT